MYEDRVESIYICPSFYPQQSDLFPAYNFYTDFWLCHCGTNNCIKTMWECPHRNHAPSKVICNKRSQTITINYNWSCSCGLTLQPQISKCTRKSMWPSSSRSPLCCALRIHLHATKSGWSITQREFSDQCTHGRATVNSGGPGPGSTYYAKSVNLNLNIDRWIGFATELQLNVIELTQLWGNLEEIESCKVHGRIDVCSKYGFVWHYPSKFHHGFSLITSN